jgi:hypothetical protein
MLAVKKWNEEYEFRNPGGRQVAPARQLESLKPITSANCTNYLLRAKNSIFGM